MVIILYSGIMSSRANITPPIGTLNVALRPPAAPAPTRIIVSRELNFKSCPRNEPKEEQICTIGPFLPTEPPLPIVIAEATVLIIATLGFIFPLFSATANITSGTP